MAKKRCDNTSAGALIWRGTDLLLIERKQYNFGFACPAGHNDGDDPRKGAYREVQEEVGLDLTEMELVLEKRYDNPCSREGGDFHIWSVYESRGWKGAVQMQDDEVLSYLWASPEEVARLAKRYEQFAERKGCAVDDLVAMAHHINEDGEWRKSPGLEPVWYLMLKDRGVVK